ncbi:unnamed protein product [Rotaria socialis]|uniref:Uncharacterized protein n=2 Tax=Rotaria socialis TaxID=392032 RepID=A0A818NIK4_9BILA|nr:unnamed protein product [Rotaria socialis]
MLRKKTTSSKVKTRKEAYKRKQQVRSYAAIHSWRILLLTIKAVHKFSRFKHKNGVTMCVSRRFSTVESNLNHSYSLNYCNNTQIQYKSVNLLKMKEECVDLIIIQNTTKKIVSKVCRLDYERKRQMQNRKQKLASNTCMNTKSLIIKHRRQRIWSNNKYSQNSQFREEKNQNAIKYFRDKYNNNNNFRMKEKERIKTHMSLKYHNNAKFRVQNNTQASRRTLNKYHNNTTVRSKIKTRSKIDMLHKYHANSDFRNQYKARMKTDVLKRYYTNHSIRLKAIQRALNSYHKNNTLMTRNLRQLYNQRRCILKKDATIQSHQCILKHGNLYIQNIKEFRKIIQNGPDYVCISCGLALFRNQVIPFIKEKYIKESMSFEVKKKIRSYFNHISFTEQQLPSRVLLSKLEVSEIPSELKRLNNLEKHLVALRLPFMKIVNLTSGKIPSRLSQKKY